MSEDREFWSSLDRRLSDIESKMSLLQRDYQRDYTDLQRDIRENTGRVNNGLSPSIQKAIAENGENKLAIEKLTTLITSTAKEMRAVVADTAELTSKMLSNFKESELGPVKKQLDVIINTCIYGLVGAVILGLGTKGIEVAWDHFFKKPGVVSVGKE